MSLGLSAAGSVMKGMSDKAGADFQAAKAERAAQFGRVQSDLTDVSLRERLNTTLGNIEAVRAAGNVDPTSPTTQAYEDLQTKRSDRQREASLLSIRSQVAEDEASAAYLRQAGNFSLLGGVVGGVTKGLGGVAKGLTDKSLGFSLGKAGSFDFGA